MKTHKALLNTTVIVAALGYFVDVYDLILFSIVRVQSLKSLGFEGEELFQKGLLLLNLQMAGMLFGGIFWGILGDKKGRLSVLFGSILTYSVANFLNAHVTGIGSYAILRFIAGVGLAGELGAGITLVSEILPTKLRGYGTTLVASVGICGALLAALVAELTDWRVAFSIGGGLGLLLLLLRVSVFESEIFDTVKKSSVKRGNFFQLFSSFKTFERYLSCILIGIPVWFIIGILVSFAPEFAKAFGCPEEVSASLAVTYCYAGLALGDIASGVLSQILKSRKKVVGAFLLGGLTLVLFYLRLETPSTKEIYTLCALLGFSAGYWALLVTIGAEQFGTNLRATVTTTVPNFVRGSLVPITILFSFAKTKFGIIPGALCVGLSCLAIAFLGLSRLTESFHKDLNYIEEMS